MQKIGFAKHFADNSAVEAAIPAVEAAIPAVKAAIPHKKAAIPHKKADNSVWEGRNSAVKVANLTEFLRKGCKNVGGGAIKLLKCVNCFGSLGRMT